MFRFTIRDVLWLTVVVGLAVAWWVEHRAAMKRATAKPRWEYRRNFNLGDSDLDAEGAEGWELVQMESQNGNRVFYFKRPK